MNCNHNNNFSIKRIEGCSIRKRTSSVKQKSCIAVILLLCLITTGLTACSSTGTISSNKVPLNALSLGQLADKDNNIYSIGFLDDFLPAAMQILDENNIHITAIDPTDGKITLIQEDLIDYEDYLFKFSTMGETVFEIDKSIVTGWRYHLQYTDTDNQYIIFKSEDDVFLILMKKQIMEKLCQDYSNTESLHELYNYSLEKWIEILDSWK